MTRAEEIAKYHELNTAYRAAQDAENEAFKSLHVTRVALAQRLTNDALADANCINRAIQYKGEKCLVVGVRVHHYQADTVRPVIVRRTQRGAWGKIPSVAGRARWDFDACDWVIGE